MLQLNYYDNTFILNVPIHMYFFNHENDDPTVDINNSDINIGKKYY
jgi:hypothetical protein